LTPAADPARGLDPALWLRLAAVGLGVAVAPLDSAVNVAFPTIAAVLGLEVADIRWVIVCYVITYAALLLAFGRAGDRFGHRRVFLLGLVWSLFSLSLCASATSAAMLLLARMLQGVGAALVLSTAAALATHALPAQAQRAGVSGYMFAFALATAVGPLLGGLMLQHWGWPAVFWFRIPLALLAVLLVLLLIPAPRRAPRGPPTDLAGTLVLAASLVFALLLVSQLGHGQWPPPLLLALALAAAVGLAWFVRRQQQPGTRSMDLAVVRRPGFGLINLAHIGVNGASFMVMLLAPFHLAHALGGAGLASGAAFALSPLGFVLASPVAGRLLAGTSTTVLAAAGAALNALGLACIALWPVEQGPVLMIASLFAHGFGYGLFQVACLNHVMLAIPRDQHGVAGSLNMLTRTVGVVSGVGAGSVAFNLAGGEGAGAGSAAFAGAFSLVFSAAAVLVLCVSGALLAARR
jgi:MFS family permease